MGVKRERGGGGRESEIESAKLTLNAKIQSFISLSLCAASTQSILLFHVDSVWIVNWKEVLRSPEENYKNRTSSIPYPVDLAYNISVLISLVYGMVTGSN